MKKQEFPTKLTRYRSYVVRCWQEDSVHARQKTKAWRFSLEDTRTNQRRGFATLEALLVSMQSELDTDKVDLDQQDRKERKASHGKVKRTSDEEHEIINHEK